MLSDNLLELDVLARLRGALRDTSPWAAIGSFLVIALVAVVVDYGRMLWLRSKMVSPHLPPREAWRLLVVFTDRITAARPAPVPNCREHLYVA